MDIKIVPMTMSDITAIEPIFSKQFDKFWSIETLKSDFSNDNTFYYVAVSNNEIIGLVGFIKVLNDIEIMNIVVRLDKRGLGIGSLLLDFVVNKCAALNCSNVFLEVNENNSVAIALYKKYNFERIGFRKKYYNNTDNAILMRKILN